MGRKSALTDKQWSEIEKRLMEGEKAAKLAEEFGINRSQITRRLSQHIATVKTVANQIVDAERALHSLPVAQQISVISLADSLRAISGHLAGAANYGAATAHRLAGIANMKVLEVDDSKPLDDKSRDVLRDIAVLSKMANEASEIPLNLLKANKDAIDEVNRKELEKQSPANPARGTVFKIIRPNEHA